MVNLYLIGGRPCSGKTTLAYLLGKKHKINVEYLDNFANDCVQNSTIKKPYLFEWKTNDMIHILQKDPNQLLIDYLSFYDEMFPLLYKKIKELNEKDLIMEGSVLLPKYIEQLDKIANVKVCYLITEDEFVNEKYPKRDYATRMILTVKGKIALNNLLQRDRLYSKYLCKELEKYEFEKIKINNESVEEKQVNLLSNIFNLR